MLKNKLKKLQGGVVATIALGMLGSAAFEFLFKPGMGQVSRLLLNIVTFGSKTVRDAAYSSAALDPTPLLSLLTVGFLTLVPIALFPVLLNHNRKRNSKLDRILNDSRIRAARLKNKSDHADDEKKSIKTDAELFIEIQKLDADLVSTISRIKKVDFAFSALLLTGAIAFYIMFSIIEQSVVIWRVFHANVSICAPYMTEHEERLLKSRFAGMTTREEYSKIEERLTAIAQSNNIALVKAKLW